MNSIKVFISILIMHFVYKFTFMFLGITYPALITVCLISSLLMYKLIKYDLYDYKESVPLNIIAKTIMFCCIVTILIELVTQEVNYVELNNPLSIFYILFIAPIFEEIYFRGLLYYYNSKYNNYTALLVSSLFFSLEHQGVAQKIYAFVFGIVMCRLLNKYKNIKVNIVIHILVNIIGISLGLIFSYYINKLR